MPNRIHTLLLMALLVAAATSCRRRGPVPPPAFTDELRLPTTPVKDQGRSQLCWLYAALATVETEHLAHGDSVNVSPHFTARAMLAGEARRCWLSGGRLAVSLRGMCTGGLRLLRDSGAVPYDSYWPRKAVSYNALSRRVAMAVSGCRSLPEADAAASAVCDDALGPLPCRVYMFGAEYSPADFAQSVCRRGEWRALTSFTHHPFGRPFVLEVPDNRLSDAFLNVPLDTLMATVERSLRRRHPVCWEGDISEEGFGWARGVADVAPGTPCGQQARQRGFERRQTTDDHCMALVGLARDRRGRRFFIAKNSWGTDNRYGGYVYMSADYVRLKTIAVLVHE